MRDQSAYKKRWVAEHREQVAVVRHAWEVAHADEIREKRRERARLYAERHPEKIKARSAVQEAKRSGGLILQACEICGSTTRIHAHHAFGYDQPLSIWWLCNTHHQGMHDAMRTMGMA